MKFLSRRAAGFHVGGKTALAWRGIRHNLPAREPLSLWREASQAESGAKFFGLLGRSFLLQASPAITRHGGITFTGLEANATRRQLVPGENFLLAQVIDFAQ